MEYAKQYHPDLILMDMEMPVMDGHEATAIIKNDETLKGTPVIALTASVMLESEKQVRSLCDGYLRKPVSKAELIAELTRFLNHEIKETAVVAQPTITPESMPAWSPETLDCELMDTLTELIEILKKELATCQKLANTLPIDEIEEFGTRMQTLGDEYKYPPLASSGDALCAQLRTYVLDGMSRTLERYPNLVADLEALLI